MRTQRGAILIEHLVAIVVLAFVVTGVLSLLSVGYLSGVIAQELSLATNLAQHKLEEIKAANCEPTAFLPREPIDAAKFRGYEWQLDTAEVAPGLKEVRATVYWQSRGRERSVTLTTLMRKP